MSAMITVYSHKDYQTIVSEALPDYATMLQPQPSMNQRSSGVYRKPKPTDNVQTPTQNSQGPIAQPTVTLPPSNSINQPAVTHNKPFKPSRGVKRI